MGKKNNKTTPKGKGSSNGSKNDLLGEQTVIEKVESCKS
jgi:hypothetical protein